MSFNSHKTMRYEEDTIYPHPSNKTVDKVIYQLQSWPLNLEDLILPHSISQRLLKMPKIFFKYSFISGQIAYYKLLLLFSKHGLQQSSLSPPLYVYK